MASAQTRIADTIELFYTGTDRTSDGALAANAYKRAVEDLDHSVTRELVYLFHRIRKSILIVEVGYLGRTLPNDNYGTSRQAQRTLPNRDRTHQQEKQKSEGPYIHQTDPHPTLFSILVLIGG